MFETADFWFHGFEITEKGSDESSEMCFQINIFALRHSLFNAIILSDNFYVTA